MIRAVLDACVLYSAFLRDLFMRLTVLYAFQPIWTEDIHREWMSNVLLNRPDLRAEQLEKTRTLMNRYGRDCLAQDYQKLIGSIVLPDLDDRHVVAAAITAKAPIIVTYNLSDFPESALASYGIQAQHPDVFLSALFRTNPSLFILAMQDLLVALQNPPVTIENRLELMRKIGLNDMAYLLDVAFKNILAE